MSISGRRQVSRRKSRHLLKPNVEFSYEPLPADCIRTLNILRVLRNSLHCTLTSQPFNDELEYHALSYAWGTEAATQAIFCNGRRSLITPHLYDSLINIFGLYGSSIRLWVDAICINQHDATEKEQQARNMRQVFGKATSVLVWLGPAEDRSDEAISLMKHLSTTL
jgi:Heterokaryon incompatibility protein (HET)